MIIEKVMRFLQSDPEIKERWSNKVDHKTQLIDSGIVDSFAIIKLITFIEEEFNIKFESNDFVEEDFYTLKNIEQLIINKKNNK